MKRKPPRIPHVACWNYNGEPAEFGALVSEHDDGDLFAGSAVYGCDTCGAAVVDAERHAEWHERWCR